MPIVSFFIAATIISLERTCWSLCSKRLVFVWTLWNKTSRDAIVPFIYAITPLCQLLRRVGCAPSHLLGIAHFDSTRKNFFLFYCCYCVFPFFASNCFFCNYKNLFWHGFSTVESQNTSWPHKEDRKFILFNVSLSSCKCFLPINRFISVMMWVRLPSHPIQRLIHKTHDIPRTRKSLSWWSIFDKEGFILTSWFHLSFYFILF